MFLANFNVLVPLLIGAYGVFMTATNGLLSIVIKHLWPDVPVAVLIVAPILVVAPMLIVIWGKFGLVPVVRAPERELAYLVGHGLVAFANVVGIGIVGLSNLLSEIYLAHAVSVLAIMIITCALSVLGLCMIWTAAGRR